MGGGWGMGVDEKALVKNKEGRGVSGGFCDGSF